MAEGLMEQGWKEYRGKCYPHGTSDVQERETRQAFYAGAFVLLGILEECGKAGEDKGAIELKIVSNEIQTTLKAMALKLKARN